jgi:hypothetical protein
MKNWKFRNAKLFISLIASLAIGAVFTFLFLPHFQWYWRRSTNVQLVLKGGLLTIFSLIAFIIIFLVLRWMGRYSVRELITIVNGINKRLPDLAGQDEFTNSPFSNLFPILSLSLIPIVLALVNQEWMFTHAGDDDPWRYISLGYYYFKAPALYSGSYKLSRMAWILIEYAIRNLFTPATAEIILALGLTIVASIGFYLLVSRFFGKRTAFISSALLSTYSYYLVSRSPDYHNIAGSLFLIWSLYFLTLATQSKKNPRWWFFATGLTYGIAVHSELFVLGCFPAMVVQFLMLSWGNKRSIWKAILFSLLGFLFTTGLLGVAAVISGRNFFFFMNQINFVADYSQIVGTRAYSNTNWKWPLQAKHLALPAAAFLFAAGCSIRNLVKFFRSNLLVERLSWFQTSINLQFTLVGIVWLIGEISKREALIRFYFVNPVYIYAFLVFAGFLTIGRQEKISPVILGSVPVVVCSVLAFSDRIFLVIGSQLLPRWQILQPLLLYLFIFTCLILFKRWKMAALLIVILMSLGNVMGIYTGTARLYIASSQISLDTNRCHIQRDGYLSVIDTSQRLWGFGWNRTHIWWDATESIPLSNCPGIGIKFAKIGTSVTRIGIQKMKDEQPTLPIQKISSAYYRQLTKQDAVVSVITNDPSKANQMLAKLRTFGNWSLASQDTILEGDIRFSLYVFTLDDKIR